LAALDGGGALDARGIDLSLDARGAEVGALTRLASSGRLSGLSGEWSGKVRVAADLGSGAEPLVVAAELDRLEVRYGEVALRNLEPVRFALAGAAVRIDSFYLGEEGSDSEIFLAGEVALGDETELDLNLQTTLDSEWLEPLFPGVSARGGEIDAIASVGGSPMRPRLNGVGELRGARLVAPALPHSCENVRATVLFYPEQLVLDRAVADVAGGRLYAGGTVGLRRLPELDYSLQVSAEGLDVRYPEGWLLRGDAELSLVSAPQGRELRGLVELERAYYLEDVALGLDSLLREVFEPRRIEVGETDELLAGTALDLLIQGPQALRVRNNLARLDGDIDLSLRGTLARPALFGRVDVAAGGELVFSGNEYRVERGQLTFVNPYRVEPVIDLVASTDLREYDVTLNVSGTLERLSTQFSSDPPLADLEILTLLTGGEDLVDAVAEAEEDTAAGGAAESFLYGQASSLITSRVNRLFGLDKLRIDPLTSSSGDLSSARLTVGKRLSRDLFATYSFDPSTTEQQILQLEWSVSPTLVLVCTQDGDGTDSLDARWEKAF
jgi:translocation and assembly module TamB